VGRPDRDGVLGDPASGDSRDESEVGPR
jgi:hypothetical protein